MKRMLLLVAAIAVCMLNKNFAQLALSNVRPVYTNSPTYSDLNIQSFSFDSRHSLNNINLKAVKDFLNRYKNEDPAEVKWELTQKSGFIARFNTGSIDVTAAYDKSGGWLYSIRRYDEDDLPGSMRSMIKNAYKDYKIVHVEEVTMAEDANIIYFVTVQSDANIKVLRLLKNDVEVRRNLAIE